MANIDENINDPDYDPAREKREAVKSQDEIDKLQREGHKAEKDKAMAAYLQAITETDEKKRKNILEDIGEIDTTLRAGLSLILNYFAQEGQFNQQLLEDIVPLIGKRHEAVKRLK
jgi:hypothetical protein